MVIFLFYIPQKYFAYINYTNFEHINEHLSERLYENLYEHVSKFLYQHHGAKAARLAPSAATGSHHDKGVREGVRRGVGQDVRNPYGMSTLYKIYKIYKIY